MNTYSISLKAFGESAILIEWPKEVNTLILDDILSFQSTLSKQYESRCEMVVAYNSMALIFKQPIANYQQLVAEIREHYASKDNEIPIDRFLWKLPVCYDDDFGLDMPYLENQLAKSKEEIIALHTAATYTVYGIGFLPGFMYLGGLSKELETQRRDVPRLEVDKGSVGLAGKQTGIYPQDSPGGWNIIGKCPAPMFEEKAKEPCFVNVGDKVKFFPISRAEFEIYQIEANVGILKPEKELYHGQGN